MDPESFATTGQSPVPRQPRCSACGRVETAPGARFCGTCGGALGAAPAVSGYDEPVARAAAVTPYMPPSVSVREPGGTAPLSVVVPRVGLLGFAKMAAAVGAAFSLLPCLIFAFAVSMVLHWSRLVVDGWTHQELRVPIINAGISMNFVQLLGMEGPHRSLVYWDDRNIMTFAILWLVPWLLAIVGSALFGLLLAIVYNASAHVGGGVQFHVVPRR